MKQSKESSTLYISILLLFAIGFVILVAYYYVIQSIEKQTNDTIVLNIYLKIPINLRKVNVTIESDKLYLNKPFLLKLVEMKEKFLEDFEKFKVTYDADVAGVKRKIDKMQLVNFDAVYEMNAFYTEHNIQLTISQVDAYYLNVISKELALYKQHLSDDKTNLYGKILQNMNESELKTWIRIDNFVETRKNFLDQYKLYEMSNFTIENYDSTDWKHIQILITALIKGSSQKLDVLKLKFESIFIQLIYDKISMFDKTKLLKWSQEHHSINVNYTEKIDDMDLIQMIYLYIILLYLMDELTRSIAIDNKHNKFVLKYSELEEINKYFTIADFSMESIKDAFQSNVSSIRSEKLKLVLNGIREFLTHEEMFM